MHVFGNLVKIKRALLSTEHRNYIQIAKTGERENLLEASKRVCGVRAVRVGVGRPQERDRATVAQPDLR